MPFDYRTRRQNIFKQLQENSAMLVFSAPEALRNGDADYAYRQDSHFLYLTGFNEPEAVLLLIKTSDSTLTILFNRKKDYLAEIWNGRRLGQEAAPDKLKIDKAFAIEELEDELLKQLQGIKTIYHRMGYYQYSDDIVNKVLGKLRKKTANIELAPIQLIDWAPLLNEARLFKSPEELTILQKACDITAEAHNRAIEACRPKLFEYQLEAEILYHFMFSGTRYPAYNSIVGGGANACILHYTENNAELRDGEMVLIDAGCEFNGYAGDITRTFPINGRFTTPQRQIYDLVLRSQEIAFKHLIPGKSIQLANDAVIHCLTSGLVELGILSGDVDELIENKAYKAFYMHGLGHWLGLDVHDVGNYVTVERSRKLEPNMVLTVEPGLYITPSPTVPEIYWNIGVRIEDNIVITETGNKILTAAAIKDPDEIEKLMAKSKR